ncbi:MAG: serpin family protein [Cyclobacteriaceae bacterium]
MKRSFLMWMGCLIALWSCQKEQVSPADGENLRKLTFEEQELIRATNQFAFTLTRQMADLNKGNIFLSPYDISMNLSMALNGAENKTLSQMQKVMHCDHVLDRLAINKVYSDLTPFLRSIDDKVSFVSAQALWHQQEVILRPLFRDMMIAYYKAGVEPLNFESRKAPSHIGKWIEERTLGRLEAQVPALSANETLYAVSASHFKGQWTFPFAKESTAPGTFHTENDTETIVPMMFTDQASYLYHQDSRKTLLDIPFGNTQYSMTILMPHQQDSLSGLLLSMHPDAFAHDLSQADTLDYHLYLPKFSIYSQSPLKGALTAMGMPDAFTEYADFSGMLGDSTQYPLSQLMHHAGIELDEAGVQSAMPRAAAALGPDASPVVRINRSFVFFIREKHTGLILYSGIFDGLPEND